MPAIEASAVDIIVLADADVVCDGLGDAIEAVRAGAPWAIPHLFVHRLTERSTSLLLDGALPEQPELSQRRYRGVQGGGMLVAPRATLLDVPLDPRFVGWGQEDTSHAVALHCLTGPAWRGTADLTHLWHEPQPRMNRKVGCPDGQRLHRRYLAARRDKQMMRDLIEEGRHATSRPSDAPLHHHAA